MKINKKVVIAFAGRRGMPNPEMPLALPYLAWALEKAGYDPLLLDMRVTDYRKIDLSKLLCVGISCWTNNIPYGLEFAMYVRKKDPSIPIIWGGPHPSMLPEQTARSRLVDIVVCGEGEVTLIEVMRNLELGKSLEDVKGITYRDGENIKTNPPRDFMDLNEIDIKLPYHLLELHKYPAIREGMFPIQTSRGCPHRCGFCYNLAYNRRTWRTKSAELIIDEIEHIAKNFNAGIVLPEGDDNFFVSRKRVENILKGLNKRKLGTRWGTFCRYDYFSKFDDDFIRLLEDSGCEYLAFGGESGSPNILNLIQKDISVSQIISTAERLADSKINHHASFMLGFPDETKEDLKLTFDLVDRLARIDPTMQLSAIFVFTPFPGTDLYSYIIRKYNFKPPKTLKEWGSYRIFENIDAPWLNPRDRKLYDSIGTLTRFKFFSKNYQIPPHIERIKLLKYFYRFFNLLARWRWRHKFFLFPIEWFIVKKVLKRWRGYV